MAKLKNLTQDFIKTSFGNILEWYDFTIYGLFAIQISKAFFPNNSHFVGLLLVFATFAVGFLARPLGSIIFGMIGDRKGKHYAVNLSVWFMVVPTALIGLMPSYSTIGVFAPILLVILRICQGVSAGGQFSGLIAIAVDSDAKNKSFLVSLVYAISVIGCFVASIVGYISITVVKQLNPTQDFFISTLSWRVPFILSILLFYVYYKMTPEFAKHNIEAENKFTVKDIFKEQPREVIIMIIVSAMTGTLYYILFTYLVTYLQLHIGISKQLSFLVENGALALSIILYPLFGYYANSFGERIKNARVITLLMLVSIVLLMYARTNLWFGALSVLWMVITFCAVVSFVTSAFAEVFKAKYRMTACSFSFNTGIAMSGFAPLIAELLSKFFQYGLQIFLSITVVTLWLALGKLIKTKGYALIKN